VAHDVFISYNHNDKLVADSVCASLENAGVSCWIAPRDIVPGREWGEAIVEAIRSAQVMVLIFSHDANESGQVAREVERAVHHNVVLISFRIEDLEPTGNLEYFLGIPHWLDAYTPPLEVHLQRLVQDVPTFFKESGTGDLSDKTGTRPNAPDEIRTMLIADIDESVRRWDVAPDVSREALARYEYLTQREVDSRGSHVFKTLDNSLCAAFADPSTALQAAIAVQLSLTGEPWPELIQIHVGIALHSGASYEREGEYFGPVVNRVARLGAAAHGGQVLVSAVTAELLRGRLPEGVQLTDLGLHRLSDLSSSEKIYLVAAEGLGRDFPPLRTIDNPSMCNNLPEQLTEFVGRDRELAEIRLMLLESRILTVVGAGGAGKTRLALQLAAGLLDGTGDGVWLVELAPIEEPELVTTTIHSVLGIHAEAGRPATEVLVDALAHQSLLLVLDNCEHLVDTCARLAEVLVRSCPKVHILATSREPLKIEGELVYWIPSLSLPPETETDPEEILRYDAVRFFVERARHQLPQFIIDGSNAAAVASLCRQLDGLPLAIELATARLRTMSLDQIQSRLDKRFRLLVGSTRTAPARQQTLRAMADWSYDLLSEPEQRTLRILSVFVGGFDLEAAEAMCADELEHWDADDLVASLVEKSLLQANTGGDKVRFAMLETIRQYASELLTEEGVEALRAARNRHARYFVRTAEDIASRLRGPEQSACVVSLEQERANLRAASIHLLEDPDGAIDGLHLGIALRWFWLIRSGEGEGATFLKAALARPEVSQSDNLRAEGFAALGALLGGEDFAGAATALEKGGTIARELGDDRLVADIERQLGWIAIFRGGIPEALAHAGESIAIAQLLGDPLLLGGGLSLRATCRRRQGDRGAALIDYGEAISLFRQAGDQWVLAITMMNLAVLEIDQKDLTAAKAHLEEAHSIASETHDASLLPVILSNLGNVAMLDNDVAVAADHYLGLMNEARRAGNMLHLSYALLGLALCATTHNEYVRSATLHGASSAFMNSLGLSRDPLEGGMQERDLALLRSTLGSTAFEAAYRKGERLDPEAAIDLARSEAPFVGNTSL
jgi:predicted ATPase/class 3 adenylate cyclase